MIRAYCIDELSYERAWALVSLKEFKINFKCVAFCTYGELVGTEKGGCEGVEA